MATILVVEDDYDIQRVLDLALMREGYTVILANDGQEGLDKLDVCKPDLILLDIMMPRMDGKTMLAILHERHSTIPVAVITASPLECQKAWQDYRIEYAIQKPFDLDYLYDVVKSLTSHTSSGEFAAVLIG